MPTFHYSQRSMDELPELYAMISADSKIEGNVTLICTKLTYFIVLWQRRTIKWAISLCVMVIHTLKKREKSFYLIRLDVCNNYVHAVNYLNVVLILIVVIKKKILKQLSACVL